VTAPPTPQEDEIAGVAQRYAVAVTMTNDKKPPVINIVTYLEIYEAVSSEEARGKALIAATEQNPEHTYSHMAIVPVPETAHLQRTQGEG
jgi:hypothetical protein